MVLLQKSRPCLTWIASPDKKVEESRKLGVVDSGKFVHSGRLRAPAVHGVSSISMFYEIVGSK